MASDQAKGSNATSGNTASGGMCRHEQRLDALCLVMRALAHTEWDLSVDDLIALTEYVRTGEYRRGSASEHLTVTKDER